MLARDEHALIAVRHREHEAAKLYEALEQARREAIVIERETEEGRCLPPPPTLDSLDETVHLLGPARLERRPGGEE